MAANSVIYTVEHEEETHLPFATKVPRSDVLPAPATYSPPAAAADARRPKQRIRSSRGRSCGGICCCILSSLCGFLVAAIVALGVAALVIWLVLRPIKAPQYSVEKIQFQNFSLSTTQTQAGSSTTVLNSDILLTIQANNPNKKIGIIYDRITATASFNGNELGSGDIPPFYQGHQNITTVTAHLSIVNFALTQSVADSLTTDISINSIPLQVRTSVKARVKIGAFKSFAFWVHVTCDLRFSPPSSGNLGGTVINKSCKVTR